LKYNFIAIEGNIGAGKTTLSKMLAEKYNAKLVLEEFAENPFLAGFYENPEKYAFMVEMFFLTERYQQLSKNPTELELFSPFTIADYFIYKTLIFAKENLNENEFLLFKRMFDIMINQLPKPDLLIYLYAKPQKLKENILSRGREYEKNITHQYLEKIQTGYLNFFKELKPFPILIVDISTVDFVKSESDFIKLEALLHKTYTKNVHLINL